MFQGVDRPGGQTLERQKDSLGNMERIVFWSEEPELSEVGGMNMRIYCLTGIYIEVF